MSTKRMLILGSLLLCLHPILALPYLLMLPVFFYNLPFVGWLHWWGFDLVTLVGGMALLLAPLLYRDSDEAGGLYVQVDRFVAASIVLSLVILMGTTLLVPTAIEPRPHVGIVRLLVLGRVLLNLGVMVGWACGLAFGKWKWAVVLVLCNVALSMAPYPNANNPDFLEMFPTSYFEIHDDASGDLSETDVVEYTPAMGIPAVIYYYPRQSYLLLLAAYTFMRFGWTRSRPQAQQPTESA